jgi:TolB protein
LGKRTCLIVAGLCALAGIAGCTFFGDRAPEFTHWEPDLSPDATTLAYESPVDGTLELFTRDLATGEQRRLTENDVEDWSPSWSPNGDWLAFASSRDKNADVYLLELESLEVTRLTTHEDDDINPSWGADGRIYFNSNRSGVWEIYAIDPDGSQLAKITEVAE